MAPGLRATKSLAFPSSLFPPCTPGWCEISDGTKYGASVCHWIFLSNLIFQFLQSGLEIAGILGITGGNFEKRNFFLLFCYISLSISLRRSKGDELIVIFHNQKWIQVYCTIFWKVYIFQKYNSNISLEFHLWPIQSEQLHATMIPISIQDPARDHAPVSPRKILDKIFQRKSFHRDACSTSGNRCKYIHRPLSLPTDGSRHAKPRISYIRIAINENKLKRKKREEKKNI